MIVTILSALCNGLRSNESGSRDLPHSCRPNSRLSGCSCNRSMAARRPSCAVRSAPRTGAPGDANLVDRHGRRLQHGAACPQHSGFCAPVSISTGERERFPALYPTTSRCLGCCCLDSSPDPERPDHLFSMPKWHDH